MIQKHMKNALKINESLSLRTILKHKEKKIKEILSTYFFLSQIN